MKTRKITNLIISGLVAVTLSSCYSATTCVGTVKADDPVVKVNSVKNHHFIVGFIDEGKTKIEDSKYIGERKNYKVKKCTTFVDGFIEFITMGIYSPTTTIYYVPLDENFQSKKRFLHHKKDTTVNYAQAVSFLCAKMCFKSFFSQLEERAKQ